MTMIPYLSMVFHDGLARLLASTATGTPFFLSFLFFFVDARRAIKSSYDEPRKARTRCLTKSRLSSATGSPMMFTRFFSQAFERIYVLVLRYNHLKYRYELGLVGMKDGPVPYSTCPPKL